MKALLKNGLFTHIIGQKFICMIGHILHLYFFYRAIVFILYFELEIILNSRKASTLLVNTWSLVGLVVGLFIF